uniref:NADH-ubiquinone oxidoreductase chain 2 n=1 Tax=Mantheyus phuwuanensis TaxID=282162 RepID=Q6E5N5_9SAUR|nr:NADH dehydrogenase subunit 2 [Mantheyus phuwuanensis]
MPLTATIMMYLGLITGTTIVMMSHIWLTAWMGLAMNTIAALPIIAKPNHPRAIEASTKYFLTQTIASALLLASSTFNAWQMGHMNITQMTGKPAATVMIIALAMKLGAAPTHFWLPEVLQGSTMKTCLLITTWQKIAPVTLMYMISNHTPTYMTMTIAILSTAVGGWGGMNQTQLRKMMAYSSISNTGWTMLVLTLNPNLALMNIAVYIIMTIPVFLIMTESSTKTMQDISTMWAVSPAMSTMLAILLLSLSGVPPLTGFIPKLLILNETVSQNFTLTATIMALMSLLNLMFYMRTAYLTMMLTPPISSPTTVLWRQKINHTVLITTLIPTATASITLMPTIVP